MKIITHLKLFLATATTTSSDWKFIIILCAEFETFVNLDVLADIQFSMTVIWSDNTLYLKLLQSYLGLKRL